MHVDHLPLRLHLYQPWVQFARPPPLLFVPLLLPLLGSLLCCRLALSYADSVYSPDRWLMLLLLPPLRLLLSLHLLFAPHPACPTGIRWARIPVLPLALLLFHVLTRGGGFAGVAKASAVPPPWLSTLSPTTWEAYRTPALLPCLPCSLGQIRGALLYFVSRKLTWAIPPPTRATPSTQRTAQRGRVGAGWQHSSQPTSLYTPWSPTGTVCALLSLLLLVPLYTF